MAVVSIGLLGLAVLAFAVGWAVLGRVPVTRAFEEIGPLLSLVETSTRLFVVGAVAGCSLGGFGLRRLRLHRRARTLAIVGLVGNALWLAALTLLVSTA